MWPAAAAGGGRLLLPLLGPPPPPLLETVADRWKPIWRGSFTAWKIKKNRNIGFLIVYENLASKSGLGHPNLDLFRGTVRIRILPFSHKGVERTEIMLAKKNFNTKFIFKAGKLKEKNNGKKNNFLASLKSLKKGVGSGFVSQRYGSAPKCHGSPALIGMSLKLCSRTIFMRDMERIRIFNRRG
jgi:hypothetical protein